MRNTIEYKDFVSLVYQMRQAEARWYWSGQDSDKENLNFWKAEVDLAIAQLRPEDPSEVK